MSGTDDTRRLEALFHAALDEPGERRRAFVDAACADVPELHARLLRMLELDQDDCSDPFARAVGESVRRLGAAPASGMRLGAWKIIDEIGSGGMGTVFLAERADGAYSGHAAIKVIRGLPDRAGLERLKRERQILADLQHPNIARLLDGGTTDDGQPFLVLEYVSGQPIDEWCRRDRGRPDAIVRLLLTVLDAVAYAHRHLVIHRDIKPGNVLMTNEGHPVLMDFGIARLLETDDDDIASETVGGTFHTPGFASPEQAAGGRITTASDIYSLGRLMAELLATASEPIPRELAAIVEYATREEPEQRYRDAGEFRADLVAWLDERPVAAVSDRRSYRVRKFLRRNRYAAGIAAAGLALALVLVGQLMQENQRARAAEARAQVEAANAEQVLDLLIGAIEAVQPGEAQGREITVQEVIERAEAQIGSARLEDPRPRIRILTALGLLYQSLERNEKAVELLDRAAQLARSEGRPADEIRALALLGISEIRLGRNDAAGKSLSRGTELAERHPELPALVRADAWNSFGVWATEMDRLGQARAALDRALILRREANAPGDVVASTLHNMGLVATRNGDFTEALDRFDQALALKRDTIGRLHPSYVLSITSKAVALGQLGRYSEVREAADDALEIRRQLLGDDHPGLHASIHQLANIHHDLGDFDRAIELYRRALELEGRSLGNRSDWLYVNNLGAAFEDQGDVERAETQYRASIELRRELFGPEHSATLRARHNLARVLLAQGKVNEAGSICDEVLRLRTRAFGAEHPDTLRSRLLAARITLAADPDDATSLDALTESVASFAQALSPESFSVLNARAALGRALLQAGDLESARRTLEGAAAGFRKALAPDHPLAAAIELDLAYIDQAGGDRTRALQRLAAAGPIVRERFSLESEHVRKLDCLEADRFETGCWLPTRS